MRWRAIRYRRPQRRRHLQVCERRRPPSGGGRRSTRSGAWRCAFHVTDCRFVRSCSRSVLAAR
jgi:hypothetical protein